MTALVYKYRMFVQARFDLTPEEIRQYQATKTANRNSPGEWPWRDTGEFVHARSRNKAKAFYAALRQIKPPIKVKAEYVSGRGNNGRRSDVEASRAWRGFGGIMGTIGEAADEVRHFPADQGESGYTECGIKFSAWYRSNGKPECPLCLEAAVARHPEMKQYL